MKRIFRTNILFLIAAVAAFLVLPVVHAQELADSSSSSAEAQPPYPPPPPPPQAYEPPPPPPSYVSRHDRDWRNTAAVGVTRQLSQSMTNGGPATVWTTDSTGFLATIRSTPFWGTGTEINYGYTQLSEEYRAAFVPGVYTRSVVPASMHELTGAFVWESHYRGVKPFLSLGGGAIDFVPLGNQQHQWRGAGLAEWGLDIPASRHLGIRVEGRGLFYRAPNFNVSALESRSWVATVEPAVSLYTRW